MTETNAILMPFPEFWRLQQKFNEFANMLKDRHIQANEHVLNEVSVRINQLAILGTRVVGLTSSLRGPGVPGLEAFNHDKAVVFELRIYAESFYYIAFRIRQVLRSGNVPHLKSFESTGVRDVRNHLIEHPEKTKSPYQIQSSAFSYGTGPVLKFIRSSDDAELSVDKGLYANSHEFFEDMMAALSRATSRSHKSYQ